MSQFHCDAFGCGARLWHRCLGRKPLIEIGALQGCHLHQDEPQWAFEDEVADLAPRVFLESQILRRAAISTPYVGERCIQKSHCVSIGSNDFLDEPLLRRAGQAAQVMQLSYLRVHMLCRRAKTVCLVYTSGLLGRARLVL